MSSEQIKDGSSGTAMRRSHGTLQTDILALTREYESTAVNTFGLTEKPPLFVRGEGATLWDQAGKSYVDLVCGSSVTILGHGNAHQRAAILTEVNSGILHTGTRLPSVARARLYECLGKLVPPELDTIHLLNSGAEAVETALKAAQFVSGRNEVLSFFGAYHGRTRGALAATASKRARGPFRPFDGTVHFFPYPYGYRPPIPGHDAISIGEACLEYLRRSLSNPYSGITPSVLIVEAVQGVAGVVIPPKGFMKGLREICDEFDIVMIVDEIWNGFGRAGQWFAFERDGIVPDLVTFGKAVSGSLPLAGVIGKAKFLRAWSPGMHTSTFQGNPIACAAAVAGIEQIRDLDLLERCRQEIEPALAAFTADIVDGPGIGEGRIIGAQAGIELVRNKDTPDPDRLRRVQLGCLDRGVLVYGGGWHGNVLMLLPPLVITSNELRHALTVVANVLRETA